MLPRGLGGIQKKFIYKFSSIPSSVELIYWHNCLRFFTEQNCGNDYFNAIKWYPLQKKLVLWWFSMEYIRNKSKRITQRDVRHNIFWFPIQQINNNFFFYCSSPCIFLLIYYWLTVYQLLALSPDNKNWTFKISLFVLKNKLEYQFVSIF